MQTVVVTPDNWKACRAVALIPDHIDSWGACEEWLKRLQELTKGGK